MIQPWARDDAADARPLFPSFFMGGFECSTQRRSDGVRLDLSTATAHARLAYRDYLQLCEHGMRTARDGLRWHVIETAAGAYCWDSWLPLIRAARAAGVTVIWDLCHYGWPDGLDVWSPGFIERFARFARAAALLLRSESDDVSFYCPINEISYWAWAGGEVARMNPGAVGRGAVLKRQLVRAYVAAVAAIRTVDPSARFLVAEPLIHVVGAGTSEHASAEAYRLAQFEVHDMIAGRLDPELGGCSECLDLIGANFYADNQWYFNGSTIPLGHHAYRSLGDMLAEVGERYHRPLLISETGAEGAARPYWLHHVCGEVRRAAGRGTAVQGICLYPILDYPGWENDRLCRAGLFSMPLPDDTRSVDPEFAAELRTQLAAIAAT